MTLKPKSNHAYHHGDLRQGFIDAACAQLRKASADQLSLRALARDLGVSQTAAYRHFASKNALFAAIATQGFEMLTAELAFAAASHRDDAAVTVASANCFAVLLDLIKAGKAQGLFVDRPALLLAGIIWSSVHGLTSLLQKGTSADMASRRTDAVPQALHALANAQRPAMEMFLQGIRRQA